MAEYTNSGTQDVTANSAVLFNETPVPCARGLVRHRDGTGNFLLSGISNCVNCAYGCRNASVNFQVTYGANIAIPTTGTAGEISIGLALDGSLIPSSVSTVTPTATEAFFNVSKSISVPVWVGCYQGLSLINISSQTISVQNANIVINKQ